MVTMNSYRPLHRRHGVILSSAPYRERDALLSLFTEKGLMRMVVTGANRRRQRKQTAPFTQGEFTYVQGRDTLHTCKEITPHTMHLPLRSCYTTLAAACTIARALKLSQLPEKAAPRLFSLLVAYLDALPHAVHAATLAASFQLKLLSHDGLLLLSNRCTACNSTINDAFHYYGGEPFCRFHAPFGAFLFSQQEGQLLLTLATSRSFREVGAIALPPQLTQRITAFFSAHLH